MLKTVCVRAVLLMCEGLREVTGNNNSQARPHELFNLSAPLIGL